MKIHILIWLNVFDVLISAMEKWLLIPRDQTHEARTAVKNVDTVQAFYGSPAVPAMMDAPFTPVFIAVIFIFHPMLGWFALGGAGTLVVISVTNQFLTTRRLETSNRAAFEALAFGESANRASELVKAQGMLNAVVDRFVDKRGEALDQNMSAVDWTGAFSSFTKALRLSLQSLVLALGAWLVLQGQITAGAMIAASILLGRVLAPLEQIIGKWVMISRFRKAHRALNVLLEDDEIEQDRVNLPDPKGQLDVLDVTVVAGPDSPPILRRVSEDEALSASRYRMSELNGFPTWFKAFAGSFPEITLARIAVEREWDFFISTSDQAPHYVLSDIIHHEPWYGDQIAMHLFNLLNSDNPKHVETLERALSVLLRNDTISDQDVAEVASTSINQKQLDNEQKPLWYAAWVTVDPDTAIAHLTDTLSGLSVGRNNDPSDDPQGNPAKDFAIAIINALNGHGGEGSWVSEKSI